MGQRASPAPFLTKTYQLVDDRITDDVVSWNESGTTFVVWNTADFAKDLLPNYFKHNNFSSFIRQLNTYGFRKIVPDKWEFANDNFQRDKKELLTLIRRRKTAAGKSAATCDQSSPSHSSEDLESTSTSLPDFKKARSTEGQPVRAPFVDLSEENEKLKRDNELLITELAQTKQQCEELIDLLAKYTDVRPDQIAKYINVGSDQMDRIMKRASCRSTHDRLANLLRDDGDENNDCDGLKLFGVWVKGNEKKRCRSENMGVMGDQRKEMKTADVDAPWMKITSFGGETSKVCNWFKKSMGVCSEARAPSSSVLFLHG